MAQARSRKRRIGMQIAEHATGIVASLLFLAPIVWTVLSAFKPAQESRQPPLPPWPTSSPGDPGTASGCRRKTASMCRS